MFSIEHLFRKSAPHARTAADFSHLPAHVAIIMDGNGRWAKKHRLAVAKGHRQGTETLREIIRHTDDLGIRALCVAVSFGLILGILAARKRGTKIDFFCVMVAIIGTSMPDFIIGACLQYFFGIKWGLFPVAKYQGFQYTVLPACALSFYTLAHVSRIMRASMLEVTTQDYIKTARSKGLSEVRITAKHQIRNAIMPVMTILGPTVAAVLTGTFVIEAIFAIPGMGKYYVESVSNNDYSMTLGMTVFYGIFLVFCNLIVDILYGIADPRVRIGKK